MNVKKLHTELEKLKGEDREEKWIELQDKWGE